VASTAYSEKLDDTELDANELETMLEVICKDDVVCMLEVVWMLDTIIVIPLADTVVFALPLPSCVPAIEE